MARYRRNPDILGADVTDLLWEGVVGVGGSAVVTDRLTGPLLRGVVPGAGAASIVGKLVDAFATVASGWLGAKIVRLVYAPAARSIERGAALLAVAKLAAAVVPGYSPLGPLPIPSSWGALGGATAAKQLAAGANGAVVPGANGTAGAPAPKYATNVGL
jgi:hypothetical protein